MNGAEGQVEYYKVGEDCVSSDGLYEGLSSVTIRTPINDVERTILTAGEEL